MTTATATATRLLLTRHAIERFRERQLRLCGVEPYDPEAVIRQLLLDARFERTPGGEKFLLDRERKYGKRAWFMVSAGWRFVCIASGRDVKIVTVERENPWEN